jgi:glycine cleavage system aminomethyltransferase T
MMNQAPQQRRGSASLRSASQMLEFLAPDAAALDGAPAARSPIEWVHRREGGRFAIRAGWRIATDFGAAEDEAAACNETVGVCDLSFLGKLELQGDPADLATIVGELAGGAALELGSAHNSDGVWWCPLSASRVLAITPPERTAGVREAAHAAAGSATRYVSVHELTTSLCSNAVVGPLAREAFARATALDMRPDGFPERGFAPVSVARTAGMILRREGDFFIHLFGAGYADYIWEVFSDAAVSLGGRWVGTEAIGFTAPVSEVAHA